MRYTCVLALWLALLLSVGAACTRPPSESGAPSEISATVTPGPTIALTRSPDGTASAWPLPAGSQAPEPPRAPEFCNQNPLVALLGRLQTALSAQDGALLAALVDPDHGMDTQLIRNGRIINYDRAHAQHVFRSDYAPDWGHAAGSDLPVIGSFRDLVVPSLLEVLTRDYTLDCNRIRIGGATYEPAWPYASINFYSAFFPGTEKNGMLDWRTWLIGIRIVNGEPYLYAILQLRWEP
jgi:hypothetical protein